MSLIDYIMGLPDNIRGVFSRADWGRLGAGEMTEEEEKEILQTDYPMVADDEY
jgi:hypothetical protein